LLLWAEVVLVGMWLAYLAALQVVVVVVVLGIKTTSL
jgi:hypothetical protein